MPWDKNEDLPVAIKNTLPTEAQSVWRSAANSALNDGKDEETAVKVGWEAVKNAGWSKQGDEWKKQANNAKLFDIDVEFFSVGKWNGDEYSEHDLDDIAKNFEALRDSIKPPVKLGHNASSKINKPIEDGQPALGWVEKVWKKGNKLLARLTKVPEVVYNAIKEGRYGRVSAEIYWNYKTAKGKTFNYVLKAIALLGADTPAVTDLEDLAAYLTAEGTAFDKIAAYGFEMTEEGEIKSFTYKLEDQEMSKELEAKIASYEAEIETLRKSDTDKQAEIKELRKFKEEQEKALRQSKLEEVKSFCEELVKAGRMRPDVRDKIIDSEQVLVYSESAGFSVPFEVFKEYAKTVEALIEFDEKGNEKDRKKSAAYESAPIEVDRRAQELITAGKFKAAQYSEAVKAVLTEDDELARAYADYNKDE